ncbi:fumarate hydratase [Methanosarcinales archaeon]|nr:MAG: fumarate hydratase [Methanosarcinales archaeon]
MITKELIKDVTITILRRAETTLPSDVKEALARAYECEENEIAKVQLKVMLENVKLAEEMQRPLCQDTGIPLFYVMLGSCSVNVNFNLTDIESGIREGVKEATKMIPLRPNVVNAITREGGEANVGDRIPYINYKIADIDGVGIMAFPKGGGSENVGAFTMLSPKPEEEAVKEIMNFVLDAVLRAAGKPCPPTIIGVGIGGSADIAMSLAKEALLRPVGKRHKDARIARIEKELLDAVNNTGIGPMGLGGKTTALDLHIETADTHITSLPVAINFQCWAARKASAMIYSNGKVEYGEVLWVEKKRLRRTPKSRRSQNI